MPEDVFKARLYRACTKFLWRYASNEWKVGAKHILTLGMIIERQKGFNPSNIFY